jgi:hypothetical protein
VRGLARCRCRTPVPLGGLDKRRLVGTDAPVLSALAGTGGNGRHHPANAKNRRIRLWPLETETPRRTTAYLKVEKPRFLFLEGSADAAAVPIAAAAAPPHVAAAPVAAVATPPDVAAALVVVGAALLDAAAVRAGASATRFDALAARALPRALAPLPLAGPLATGVEAPTSLEPAPIAPFFLLLLRRRDLRSHRLRESLLLAQPVLLAVLLPALPPSDASLLLARGPLLLSSLRRARDRAGSGRGQVGPRGVYDHPLLRRQLSELHWYAARIEEGKGDHSPPGRREASRTTRARRCCTCRP